VDPDIAEPASSLLSSPGTSDLITALKERAPRLAIALAAGHAAVPAARNLRNAVRERTAYTVTVHGDDELYDDLHEWVLSLLPPKEQRAVVAWSSRPLMVMAPGLGEARERAPAALRLRYDGTREHTVAIAGHRVRVAVTDMHPGGSAEDRRWRPPQITFTVQSLTARAALLAEMEGVLQRRHEARQRPAFRMLDRWGDWERLDDLPPRTADSVILPPGQLERLTADVERWLGAEEDYLRRCVPWHRCHLYEGPPGTGKTSVARVVAHRFGMDIWYLPLADLQKDGELLRVANRISPRSMLLIEDIDVFHAATERDDEQTGVTLSGLLNTLDGIATPHGLLTILTSNRPDVLDAAMIRSGRVDLTEHFGYADEYQVRRLLARWYGPLTVTGALHVDDSGMAPADVVEACKRHPDDPAAAAAELSTMKVWRPV
jgi:hypothetical protein